MNNPLVSIIIPVYKVEQHIARCLHSVLNQRYDNIEIVLIDDCSPDRSMVIARKLLENSPGRSVRMLRHEQNRGLSAARNTGIVASTGEYIYFLDSDDEITPNCMDTLVDLALKYDVEMVQGNYRSEPDQWFSFNFLDDVNNEEYADDPEWIKRKLLSRTLFPVMSWNRLLERRFIMDNNLLFKEGIIHEDEHWNFFLAKYLKSVVYTNTVTYIYYKNNDGIMSKSESGSKSLGSWKLILEDLVKQVDPVLIREQANMIISLSYYHYQRINYRDLELILVLKGLFKSPRVIELIKMSDWAFKKRMLPTKFHMYFVRLIVKWQKP